MVKRLLQTVLVGNTRYQAIVPESEVKELFPEYSPQTPMAMRAPDNDKWTSNNVLIMWRALKDTDLDENGDLIMQEGIKPLSEIEL